jgi:hypothetical protein
MTMGRPCALTLRPTSALPKIASGTQKILIVDDETDDGDDRDTPRRDGPTIIIEQLQVLVQVVVPFIAMPGSPAPALAAGSPELPEPPEPRDEVSPGRARRVTDAYAGCADGPRSLITIA